jgi:DNA-directed RNA polymerase subunit RPC12/RpoP
MRIREGRLHVTPRDLEEIEELQALAKLCGCAGVACKVCWHARMLMSRVSVYKMVGALVITEGDDGQS